MAKGEVIVVGGGLAGLMAVIKLAERGKKVKLFSMVPVKRSHSVCAQGGINGAVNTQGEGDSPQNHFEDTLYGGDYLANQKLVKGMCEAAPQIIYMFDRMGVPFNRTSEGLLDFRRFGGTKFHRTAFAGATTGQQLLYALDEQVRRFEAQGLVEKMEFWEFLSAVIDDERVCRGITAMDMRTMEVKPFAADAVILCTGGPGLIFGRTTLSMTNFGSASSAVYQQGVKYANGEFIQIHPTAIRGEDKLRLISESVRGEGGRVWTWKDGKKWYFLEEWYPSYGNLVPRDVAARSIHKVVYEMGLGLDGEEAVHLDVTHLDRKMLDAKLKGVLEIYEKFMGEDPRDVPMKVFPAVHYSMGGIWVDDHQMTNVAGLYAAGEADYQYHGANRLGANSLLSCIYGGMVSGPHAAEYVGGLEKSCEDVPSTLFDQQAKKEADWNREILGKQGEENSFRIHKELGERMNKECTVTRENGVLKKVDEFLVDLQGRWEKIGMPDSGGWTNQALTHARATHHMLALARVIVQGAIARDESRGAHYKPDFPKRNDEKWLKTTIAQYTPDGPKLSYEEVDTSLVKPKERKYD